MSDIDFNRFMAEAGSDPEAAKAFVLAVGDRQGDDAVQAVAALAQARGYDVTAEDAARAREALLAAHGGSDLPDEALDGVDGGVAGPLPVGHTEASIMPVPIETLLGIQGGQGGTTPGTIPGLVTQW